MTVQQKSSKRRMFFLDVMRIVCAFLIYARHSITMFGCSYGRILNGLFICMTGPVMTCFFMLSGFSVHYRYRNAELSASFTKSFLKKRFIAVMPSYLLVVLLWPLVFPDQLKTWAQLLPIDLIGAQTTYRSLFGILHNGGTWFVSCILLAYLLYPVIKAVIQSREWAPAVLIIAAHFFLMYSSYVISQFSLDSLYANPIARSVEFMIGAAFSEFLFSGEISENAGDSSALRKRRLKAAPLLAAVLCISALMAAVVHADTERLVFDYLATPGILLSLLLASILRSKWLEESKLLSVLSGMSYQFFLAQLFLWKLSDSLMDLLRLHGSIAQFAVSISCCTILSYTVWRFYDKPLRKLLGKKLLSAG